MFFNGGTEITGIYLVVLKGKLLFLGTTLSRTFLQVRHARRVPFCRRMGSFKIETLNNLFDYEGCVVLLPNPAKAASVATTGRYADMRQQWLLLDDTPTCGNPLILCAIRLASREESDMKWRRTDRYKNHALSAPL